MRSLNHLRRLNMPGYEAREVLQKVKPYVAMILMEFGYAGMYVISAATLKNGLNSNVLVVYRNLVAAAVITPFALWFERSRRSKLTVTVFFKIFGLALLDPLLQQHMYYMGVKWTSASFAAAMENIIPATTFLIAILIRMEKLNLRKSSDLAKIIGTTVTVIGAVVLIIYKGPILEFIRNSKAGDSNNTADSSPHGTESYKWLTGTFMLIGSSACWASFLILQSNLLDTYPTELSLTSMTSCLGAVMNLILTVIVERKNGKAWAIGWNRNLITVVYSGVICTGVSYYVHGMVMKERGPVFAAAFDPFCLIMTAIMGSIILTEVITLGMVVGAGVIVTGLYLILWGKSKDHATSSNTKSNEHDDMEFVSIDVSIPASSLALKEGLQPIVQT